MDHREHYYLISRLNYDIPATRLCYIIHSYNHSIPRQGCWNHNAKIRCWCSRWYSHVDIYPNIRRKLIAANVRNILMQNCWRIFPDWNLAEDQRRKRRAFGFPTEMFKQYARSFQQRNTSWFWLLKKCFLMVFKFKITIPCMSLLTVFANSHWILFGFAETKPWHLLDVSWWNMSCWTFRVRAIPNLGNNRDILFIPAKDFSYNYIHCEF